MGLMMMMQEEGIHTVTGDAYQAPRSHYSLLCFSYRLFSFFSHGTTSRYSTVVLEYTDEGTASCLRVDQKYKVSYMSQKYCAYMYILTLVQRGFSILMTLLFGIILSHCPRARITAAERYPIHVFSITIRDYCIVAPTYVCTYVHIILLKHIRLFVSYK